MIHSFDFAKKHMGDVGVVVKSDRSTALMSGLTGATLGEGVSFAGGEHGMVSKLSPQTVEVMVFADRPIPIGKEGARTGSPLKISVGVGMLGDTFDALGSLVDTKKEPSPDSENRPVEADAWTMDKRAEITQFLATGVTIVDTVVPIARGQRELVIGDQKTGKTHFILEAVKTQARLGTVCIVGLIGKEQTEITRIEHALEEAGVRKHCIIVAEPVRASAARLTLVPFTAMTIAEHFRDHGTDTLVVLDDLSDHAVRYREMALLSDRFPGRDSYPNDIFYLHARLLERAGSFTVRGKRVTITCLPVASTVEGDISGYIQTNLMSMTDGHLYFDKNLFFDGVRPAVNIFISVTRVGRQVQAPLARGLGQKILSTMGGYAELRRFLRFGTELSDTVKEEIRLAHGIKEALKQNGSVSISPSVQVYLLGLLWAGKWDGAGAEQKAAKLQESKASMKFIEETLRRASTLDDLIKAIKAHE